jgi:hypothetical protein
MTNFEEKWDPILDKFNEQMNIFLKEREDHTNILMRYDEVIMEKASKFNLAELREDVVRNYVRQGFVSSLE